MAEILIENQHLVDIANSLRNHLNTEDKYKPKDMVETIQGLAVLPPGSLNFTGNCQYKFAYNAWNWFIDAFGERITTVDITSGQSMFTSSNQLTSIPFEFNFKAGAVNNMFSGCSILEEIGDFTTFKPNGAISNWFSSCFRLRQLPNFVNIDLSGIHMSTYSANDVFSNCASLRSIPEEFLKELWTLNTSQHSSLYKSLFMACYCLDEIRGVPILGNTINSITTNMFNNTFYNCARVKDIIFNMQEDGTPYVRKWSNQTIDLASSVGSCDIMNYLGSNSGITVDTQIKDDATYQALKNHPDSWTYSYKYSRYNHDSAVNTINSLPDVSSGSGNVIKFKGAAGELTDEGAINTLTEAEIAVATAKGWTVTLV